MIHFRELNRLLRFLPLAWLCLLLVAGASQPPADAGAEHRGKIEQARFLVGDWAGDGWIMTPEGRHEFKQTEEIRFAAGETIITIRGIGRVEIGGEKVVVHDAFGVLWWDASQERYRFTAHRQDGGRVEARAEITEDGVLRWGFQDPAGPHVRFEIRLTEDGRWHEKGEISMDGETWMHFFEMTLVRQARAGG